MIKTKVETYSSSFGKINNQELHIHTLKSACGIELGLCNYGGILTVLKTPDRNGNFEDIVLGFDTAQSYLNDQAYFGALIGRYANRISEGQFSIDSQSYKLKINSGHNNLHGGPHGFHKQIWNIENIMNGLRLSRLSPHMEEGFPGNLKVSVDFQIFNEHELRINYTATTDQPTICSLTHHPYFNLQGPNFDTILEHQLLINAERYTPLKKSFVPTGEILSVKNTPFDFSKFKSIGKDIQSDHPQIQLANGYDHNWVLKKANQKDKLRLAAKVKEPKHGRTMEIWTTEPGLQLFTSNRMPENLIGKNQRIYSNYCGFCLETQHFPDSPNHPHFPSTLLHPNEIYSSQTIYKFGVE